MKTIGTKLLLSAVGFALLATPAFAQRPERHYPPRALYNYDAQQPNTVGVYPNFAARTGTADAVESGAQFNVQH